MQNVLSKSLVNFETPDQTFDQSRVNAVTPMTHLFMDIKIEPKINNTSLRIPQTDVVVNVTRTGKAVTLVNLLLPEPETVFGVLTNYLYLCAFRASTSSSKTRKQGN